MTSFTTRRITQRKDFASDLWMIRVQANGEFKFAPGQYATLGVQRPEKRSERPYSIVSSPYENEIEFFFELVPQGELTPHLYKLQVGDEMLMRKVPKGRFTLDTKGGRTNHLLVSTVTGSRALRQLRPHALQGLERRNVCRRAQTVSAERRQPLLGVWLPRRTAEIRRRSSVAEVRAHGEPSLGRSEMDGRNRSRR